MELRLHSDGDERPAGPADQSLRDVYTAHLFPSLDGRRSKATLRQYRTALTHWEAFVAQRASTVSTRAPESVPLVVPVDVVSQITDAMLNAWGEWLLSPDGDALEVETAKKQWRCVRAILRRVGPRESGNPRALGYLDRVPVMDPLDELSDATADREGPADVTDEELDRIYQACDVARWPVEAAPLQWKTYLVILAVMGPRVNDAATLRRNNFSFDSRSPIRKSSRTYEHGWLVYRPTKTKSKKPARLIVPLPPCVAAHVQALTGRRQLDQTGSDHLFAWRDARGHKFADTWNAIVGQAGLPHIERRHLRSTANIRWDRAGGDRELGRWVLGHAARDVNDAHYMRAEPSLIEAAPHVEVPKCFRASLVEKPTQMFLFG